MRPSSRPGEQSGQMLVAVIVLLALMFFIGSAMALAVSSSLHTIAQTNIMDSKAYAAESAVALGLASNQRGLPFALSRAGARGPTTFSYSFEVVDSSRALAGRSLQQTDINGNNTLDNSNYEIIRIPHIPAAVSLEIFRTAAGGTDSGGTPLTTGLIGVATQDNSPPFPDTVVNDTGLTAIPADANCTSHSLSSFAPPSRANGYWLTTSSCRVPVDPVSGSVHTWSAPEQRVPSGQRTSQQLSVTGSACNGFQPVDDPGTVWGVIGWNSVSSGSPATINVSLEGSLVSTTDGSCNGHDIDPCATSVTAPGMLYYYCHLDSGNAYKTLYVDNQSGGADVNVSDFVVRAAASGTDCVVTTIGQAGPSTGETDWQLLGCGWTNAKQTLWNRVLP